MGPEHGYYDTYWSNDGPRPTGSMNLALARTLAAHVKRGDRCLDVGCGDGRTAGLWLRERGCAYTGVDVSEVAVQEARELGLDAVVIDDASSLPFGHGEFNAVTCIEVLEHLFSPLAAVAEIYRVLMPGGVLVATTPNTGYWRRRVELAVLGRWNPQGDRARSVAEPWRDPHIRFFTAGALGRMVRLAGFERVRVLGVQGSLIRGVPWEGPAERDRDRRSSPAYSVLERLWPAAFGYRLQVVAFKPSNPPPGL